MTTYMNTFLIQLIPAALFLSSLCVPLGIMLWIRYQRRHRRGPLNYQMLRAPGESNSRRIEQLNTDIDMYFTFSGVVPLLCYAGYLTTRYVALTPAPPLPFLVIATGVVAYYGVRLYRLIKRRNQELLGLDCERAVGQELNQLMLDGYRVYHDFRGRGFNIDHIVIGENGVFAVETKGRPKPVRGRGREDARVVYDGQMLQFPTWREKRPIDQAKRQAGWLSEWLGKAVGEPVAVRPVLALPGWLVERRNQNFLIYNGKNPQFLGKINGTAPLSPEMVQRIAFQVEQRCRDVEQQAYRKAKVPRRTGLHVSEV